METWRGCLRDEFDLNTLKKLLDEIHIGEITITEVATHVPSPFTEGLLWRQTNQLMYKEDSPAGAVSNLRDDLIKQAVFSQDLRPEIARELIERF